MQLVCMNNRGRGIDQYPGRVKVQHGCPKKLTEAAGLVALITIVIDVSFDNKAAKLEVLRQLGSRFTNTVPSNSNSNSIQSLREVSATTAVAPRSSFLLHNIDPNGMVKNAIDARASHL